MSKHPPHTDAPRGPRIYLEVSHAGDVTACAEASGAHVPAEVLELADKLLSALAPRPGGVPLSVDVSVGKSWSVLDHSRQQEIGLAVVQHDLAALRAAGHDVVDDLVVHAPTANNGPPRKEAPRASPLHWAFMTHDLTCVLSQLLRAAGRCPGGAMGLATEEPVRSLAVAAVAFTVQLAIEMECQDPTALRSLERALIAAVRAARAAQGVPDR